MSYLPGKCYIIPREKYMLSSEDKPMILPHVIWKPMVFVIQYAI